MATRQETYFWPYYPGNVSVSTGNSWYSTNAIDMTGLPAGATNITCASVELRYTFTKGGIDTRSGYEWIYDTDGETRWGYNINATNINNWLTQNYSWFDTHRYIKFRLGFKSVSTSSTTGQVYFSIVMQYEIDSETYLAYSTDGTTWQTFQPFVKAGNVWAPCEVYNCIDGENWTECKHDT